MSVTATKIKAADASASRLVAAKFIVFMNFLLQFLGLVPFPFNIFLDNNLSYKGNINEYSI